jgi:hypothetical protein
VRVNEGAYWLPMPVRQEASDAHKVAAGQLFKLKSGFRLPERVRVQP